MSDNISLPPTEIMDALGHRLAQASIDAASWQVAQQLTQQRGAEQIASLTEALNQRDRKLQAASQLIEEMLGRAATDPELKVTANYQFLRSFVEGTGIAVQIPQLEGVDFVKGQQAPAGVPGPPADGGHDPYKFIRENSTPLAPAADAGLDG